MPTVAEVPTDLDHVFKELCQPSLVVHKDVNEFFGAGSLGCSHSATYQHNRLYLRHSLNMSTAVEGLVITTVC